MEISILEEIEEEQSYRKKDVRGVPEPKTFRGYKNDHK
jgi:hypothetical protein